VLHAQRVAQQVAELLERFLRTRLILSDEGEQRVQRVEEEVRVDLRAQCRQLGLRLQRPGPRGAFLLPAQLRLDLDCVRDRRENAVDQHRHQELPESDRRVEGLEREGSLPIRVHRDEEPGLEADREDAVGEREPHLDREEASRRVWCPREPPADDDRRHPERGLR
jgi:hypothetical protein